MILFYLRNLSGGGVQKIHVAIREGLKKRGYDTLLVCESGGVLSSQCQDAIYTKGNLIKLVVIILRFRPSHIVVGNGREAVVVSILRLLFIFSFKIIYVQHVDLCLYGDSTIKKFIKIFAFKCVSRLVNKIVFVSYSLKESISKICNLNSEKISVIYNPVLKEIDNSDFMGAEWGSPIKILNVGRLGFQKNQDYLISVLDVLKNKNIPSQLYLVGEGEGLELLRNRVLTLALQESVFFMGWREDIPKLMSSMDIFCLTSRWEGLPTVLIEALNYCPRILAMNCPHGVKEICAFDDSSVIPVEATPEEFSARILEICRRPPVPKNLRRIDRFLEDESIYLYEKLLKSPE